MIDVLAGRLRGILGDERVITDRQRLRTYECDGLAHYKVIPALVVFPHTAEECAAVVRACVAANVPYVARGSGTGLSGGALPHADGVLIVTSQMRVDPGGGPGRRARGGRARRDQPASQQGGEPARLLLRAGPVQSADLLDRRQRRGERGRRALPEVRLHHQPRDRRPGGHPGRRPGPAGRPGAGRARVRPARRVRRLGRHARHRHRGDPAPDPPAVERCARCSPPSPPPTMRALRRARSSPPGWCRPRWR